MEEQWKNLNAPFDKYIITDSGRVFNTKTGREMKTAVRKSHGKEYKFIIIRNKFGRKLFHIGQEVYKAFGQGYQKGAHVFHKNGDITDCRIENLFIAKGYTQEPSSEQVARYEREVPHIVKHYIKDKGYLEICGLDVDNIIGESYMKIWQHLSQYKTETSFYVFCARYVRWAFLQEYKVFKRDYNNVSLEQLAEQQLI